ncbi:RdgB/HAM1 family non-canonical purine NTP pyrophosphatase [Patescibacteria group bacterium]|nr:RdgB/HAM1 family non-canonical purine NTP pyrophosphatase [Patescibacteria group bacterium]MBU4512488.1 RdgB/HAM1 family non-canonical purine NTP pyrophosphatase [Patescibacteria group bacterium]MCG2692806.1 RdgB/HAM1 family non-canonical purine NTP pyrophosphatase [Candidatus Parcubacteria bacterium]
MKLIFATHNPGKVKEMRALLQGFDVEVLSAEQAGITEDVVEDGKTFEENALKKARFVAEMSGKWALADDSGLCIKALDGAPGIHSARWAGEAVLPEDLAAYTLKKMKAIPKEKRQAHFESTLVLMASDGRHWIFTGLVNGVISDKARGTALPKLPYDLIFIPEGRNKTFAEMSEEEKNSMSHRGRAFLKLKKFLKNKMQLRDLRIEQLNNK